MSIVFENSLPQGIFVQKFVQVTANVDHLDERHRAPLWLTVNVATIEAVVANRHKPLDVHKCRGEFAWRGRHASTRA